MLFQISCRNIVDDAKCEILTNNTTISVKFMNDSFNSKVVQNWSKWCFSDNIQSFYFTYNMKINRLGKSSHQSKKMHIHVTLIFNLIRSDTFSYQYLFTLLSNICLMRYQLYVIQQIHLWFNDRKTKGKIYTCN